MRWSIDTNELNIVTNVGTEVADSKSWAINNYLSSHGVKNKAHISDLKEVWSYSVLRACIFQMTDSYSIRGQTHTYVSC